MVFSSVLFLFLFLPVTLIVYYIIKPAWRNAVLVLASIFFYAWGAPNFLILFLINIFMDYFLALLIYKFRENFIYKRVILITSVTLNLGLLIYYKYANFFVGQLGNMMEKAGYHGIPWSKVLLPIGISFFVFHKISYIVDIYRGTEKPLNNVIDFALYLMFFPQLIAGPIVRFHEIAFQIKKREHTVDLFCEGIWRFSLGLGKKVIIANTIAVVVDKVFALSNSSISFFTSWAGIILYALQIYFDFSGYSDMAIGLAKMFGFNLPENFNRPYISTSITEFWRRWHMSLSRFFKDYLYIPLGGNRCSKVRNYFNLWTVFALCGLWHGANWTFVIWGIYHGMLLIMDKVFLLDWLKKIPRVAANLLTFILVLIGWVFFRADSIAYALGYLKVMFGLGNIWSLSLTLRQLDLNNKVIFFTAIAALISFVNIRFKSPVKIFEKIAESRFSKSAVRGVISLALLLYCFALLSTGSFNPFIYFRF